jgi:DNA helicase-2/ATP-dependent DNA helicase PcrA
VSVLNQQQKAIVSCKDGAYLAPEVPGSGKTPCATRRASNLIDAGVPGDSIPAATFTNKEAGEMRDRVQKPIGDQTPVWLPTTSKMPEGSPSRLCEQRVSMINLGLCNASL